MKRVASLMASAALLNWIASHADASLSFVDPVMPRVNQSYGPANSISQLYPNPIVHLSSSSPTFQATVQEYYPGKTFTFAADGLYGTLNVVTEDARADAEGGGLNITAVYTPGGVPHPSEPDISTLHWIQVVSCPVIPAEKVSSPYVDDLANFNPTLGVPTSPYYFNTAEDAAARAKEPGKYYFVDLPNRGYPDAPLYPGGVSGVTWSAELMLVSQDPLDQNHITVYGGIKYGFYIQRYYTPGSGSSSQDPQSLVVDHSASLLAVPEPSGIAILSVGLVLFAGRRLRSRRL